MRTSALAVLICALAASAARAECWVTWNCGTSRQCGQVYGGRMSGRNGPFPSCSGWKQMDLHSRCTCGPSSGSGGGSAGGGDPMSQLIGAALQGNQQAAGMAMGMMGAQMLGAGLGQMLRGDPAAAERARQAEQARLMREAAERHERERRFVENKNRLLDQMDGGGAAPASGMAFKDDDTPSKPSCRAVIDNCASVAAEQASVLDEAARDGQAQFSKAIVEGHAKHGIELAKENGLGFKDDDEVAPPKKVWENKDQAGLPLQLNPGKVTVDDVFDHLRKKRNAALNGAYNPAKQNLMDALGMGVKAEDVPAKLRDARDTYRKLKSEFDAYMKALVGCSKGPDKGFNDCLALANQTYDKGVQALEKAGYDKAAIARVEAARTALTGYVERVGTQWHRLATEAASCTQTCR